MKKIDKSIIITAIIGIVILEAIALLMGYNGTILTVVIAIVAGLAGWVIPQPKLSG